MARVLQQHDVAGAREHRVRVGLRRAPRDRDDLRTRDDRRELVGVDDVGADHDVGRQARAQRLELAGVRRPAAEQLAAEAQRVLDGMKALEHDDARLSPGARDVTQLHRSAARACPCSRP